MNIRNAMLFVGTLFFVLGCHQAHERAVTGKTRPQIDEDEVRFYVVAPIKSENVGYVTAEAHQFTHSGRVGNLIQELRSGAAEVGANGVVLDRSQVSMPSELMTSAPLTSDGAEAVLNTDENLRAQIIYVYADDDPPRKVAAEMAPAAEAAPAPAPAATARPKSGISYATVVVNDTGDPAKNLSIANRTCHKLGKVAQRDEVRTDGTITYLCVDE
ncbi:MAG TPA: hypothetical protein VF651_02365 [Gammaproteobacteria bacterium]